jgi:hypothetical protein
LGKISKEYCQLALKNILGENVFKMFPEIEERVRLKEEVDWDGNLLIDYVTLAKELSRDKSEGVGLAPLPPKPRYEPSYET